MKNRKYLLESITVSPSDAKLCSTIVNSYRELGRTFESISAKEIKARDRVDIALEEYENMKLKIRSLESEVNYLCSILEKIEAPIDKKIIPDSVRTYYSDDYENFRRVFKVEFAIDGMELR